MINVLIDGNFPFLFGGVNKDVDFKYFISSGTCKLMVTTTTTTAKVQVRFPVCYESYGHTYWSSCQITASVGMEKSAFAEDLHLKTSAHFLNFNKSKHKVMSDKQFP